MPGKKSKFPPLKFSHIGLFRELPQGWESACKCGWRCQAEEYPYIAKARLFKHFKESGSLNDTVKSDIKFRLKG